MVVVNLFGAPCSGKSATMARLFSAMKAAGFNVEMAPEVVKDAVYANDSYILHDQVLAFALQRKKLKQMEDKVDYVITDAPLLLSNIYGDKQTSSFYDLVFEEFYSFDNVNFLLNCDFPYKQTGRIEDEAAAVAIKKDIQYLLDFYGIPYTEVLKLETPVFVNMLRTIVNHEPPKSGSEGLVVCS